MSELPQNDSAKKTQPSTNKSAATSKSAARKDKKKRRTRMNRLTVNPNDTLSVGNIRCIVRKPDEEVLGDWLTDNANEMSQEIELIYGVLKDYCTKENCPSMTAGRRFEYLWADGVNYIQPVKLSAPAYVENLMIWVTRVLEPFVAKIKSGKAGEYKNDRAWRKALKNVFKRLFRVYAHIYHSHMKIVDELGIQKHLNTSFKRFVFFVDEFKLISIQHMEPLADLVKKMLVKEQHEEVKSNNSSRGNDSKKYSSRNQGDEGPIQRPG